MPSLIFDPFGFLSDEKEDKFAFTRTRSNPLFNATPAQRRAHARKQVETRPLTGYEKGRLPSEIRAALGHSVWCLVPADKIELFRYHHPAQFWLETAKGWEKVPYSAYQSQARGRHAYALTPYMVNKERLAQYHAEEARKDATSRYSYTFPWDQPPRTLPPQIPVEVDIRSPADKATIQLYAPTKEKEVAFPHVIQPGESIHSLDSRYFYNGRGFKLFDYYNRDYSDYPDYLPLPAGKTVSVYKPGTLVTWGATNVNTVVIGWRGPTKGSRRIPVYNHDKKQRGIWRITLPLLEGQYLVTATAMEKTAHATYQITAPEPEFLFRLRTPGGFPVRGLPCQVFCEQTKIAQAHLNRAGEVVLKGVSAGKLQLDFPENEEALVFVLAAEFAQALLERDMSTLIEKLAYSAELTPKIMAVYDSHYYPAGRSFTQSIGNLLERYDVTDHHKHVIEGLLLAAGIQTNPDVGYYPPEKTGNTLHRIEASPQLSSIIQDHQFSLELVQQKATVGDPFETRAYHWYIVHDEQAVTHQGAEPVEFLTDGTQLEFSSRYLGQHLILCCYQYHPSNKKPKPVAYYSYPINVATAESVLTADLDSIEVQLHRPDYQLIIQQRYIATLKAVASNSSMDEQTRERHDAELERLAQSAGRLESLLEESRGKKRYPLRALALAIDQSGQPAGAKLELKAFLYQKDVGYNRYRSRRHTWGLVEWTDCGSSRYCGHYQGRANNDRDAILAALQDWEKNSQLAASDIVYQVDFKHEGTNYQWQDTLRTDGQSTLDTLIDYAGTFALGAAGIALLFAPVPGSRVASSAIWSSIIGSTAASTLSVYQRYDKGFSNWRDDGLDILGIVGNLFAAGWIRQVGIGFSQNSNGIQAGKYLLLGQVATDAASGIILTEDALQKIQAVQQNSQLTASEKTRQIAELLRSLALATTLTYISLKGSQADMAMLKANQPEVMIDNQILRLEVDAEQGVVDVEAKVDIPERDDRIVKSKEGDGGIASGKFSPHSTTVNAEIGAIQNLGSRQRLRYEIDPPLPGERSLTQADYKAMVALEGQSAYLNQVLGDAINSQEYVYRYTTLDTVERYYMPSAKNPNGGILRESFMTTDYLGLDPRSVMSQAQILEAWGSLPEVLLKIPVGNLSSYSVPRPFGNSYYKGYEPNTSSYPAAGAGGANQFMGTVVGWDDSWLVYLNE